MTIIQAAVLGLTAVVLALQIRTIRPEYAAYLILAAGLIIAVLGASRLAVILDTLKTIGTFIKIRHTYLETLLKMVGVTYVAEFASGICKDTGHASLGVQIEMFGKLTILVISAPVILALLEALQRMMT